jgi:polyisoprenoid-binding protein YceI
VIKTCEAAMRVFLRILTLCAAPLLSALPVSAETVWKFDRSATKMEFIARKLSAPVGSGVFQRYDGRIDVDFDHPDKSRIKVSIDTNSVATSSSAFDSYLRSPIMLDSASQPAASFVSNAVKQTSAKTLEISGTLTMRSKSAPFSVTVTIEGDVEAARRGQHLPFTAKGAFMRSAYDIGRDVNLADDAVDLVIHGALVAQ